MPFPNKDTQFKKGESGNPNGRPPKLLKHLNEELKEKGFEPVSESQVVETYLTILNMDKETILKLIKQDKVPSLFEIAAKGIGGKQGLQAVEKLLERALGKPKEKHDHTHEITEFKVEIVNKPNES